MRWGSVSARGPMCANYNGERRREHSRRKILSCFAIGNLHASPMYPAWQKTVEEVVDEASQVGYCTYISIPYFYLSFSRHNWTGGNTNKNKIIIRPLQTTKDLTCVGARTMSFFIVESPCSHSATLPPPSTRRWRPTMTTMTIISAYVAIVAAIVVSRGGNFAAS